MLNYIDSHCHLGNDRFDADREGRITLAKALGVTRCIEVGSDLPSSKFAMQLAAKHPGISAAVGIHPHEADSLTPEVLQELAWLCTQPGAVAVGEIGLDYYYNHSPQEQQRKAFVQQLELAHTYGLPVVVHCRDAWQEVIELMQGIPHIDEICGVLHCFTGNLEQAQLMVDQGWYLGIGGIISFNNAQPLRDVVKQIALDHLLLETDSPYLAPVPHRGKTNAPEYIPVIAAALAQLKGVSLIEVAEATTHNAERLFGV